MQIYQFHSIFDGLDCTENPSSALGLNHTFCSRNSVPVDNGLAALFVLYYVPMIPFQEIIGLR